MLGRLFSSTTDAVSRAETVVIITPYVTLQRSGLARDSAEKIRQTDDASGSILEQQLRLERGSADR